MTEPVYVCDGTDVILRTGTATQNADGSHTFGSNVSVWLHPSQTANGAQIGDGFCTAEWRTINDPVEPTIPSVADAGLAVAAGFGLVVGPWLVALVGAVVVRSVRFATGERP